MSTERDIDRDAARYRWLRERLEVRKLEAVNGTRRPGLNVRLGRSFFDSRVSQMGIVDRRGDELDAAIDASIRAEESA
jgi:hypothetical protein